MIIVNCTPHALSFMDTNNTILRVVEPSGMVARAAQSREQVSTIDGIPVNRTSFGQVENLPDPKEDTIYVVSALTAQACPERADVFITDDAVRDEAGRIIGCRALAHV